VEGYQLFGYLAGRNYGTPDDKQILLITHTDGPSLSQENGAIGILSVVKYFSHIPRARRPRSLMLFYDCRHFMPGMERAFAKEDYAASHPDVYSNVMASIGIEHLGQTNVEEGGGKPFRRTKVADVTTVYVTNNQRMVDVSIAAVKDNSVPRTQVQCPGRKGLHGGEQGSWYGLGSIANRNRIPGTAVIGALTGYWTVNGAARFSRRESVPDADGLSEPDVRKPDAGGREIHQVGAWCPSLPRAWSSRSLIQSLEAAASIRNCRQRREGPT
jgi:hypothetical protein